MSGSPEGSGSCTSSGLQQRGQHFDQKFPSQHSSQSQQRRPTPARPATSFTSVSFKIMYKLIFTASIYSRKVLQIRIGLRRKRLMQRELRHLLMLRMQKQTSLGAPIIPSFTHSFATRSRNTWNCSATGETHDIIQQTVIIIIVYVHLLYIYM